MSTNKIFILDWGPFKQAAQVILTPTIQDELERICSRWWANLNRCWLTEDEDDVSIRNWRWNILSQWKHLGKIKHAKNWWREAFCGLAGMPSSLGLHNAAISVGAHFTTGHLGSANSLIERIGWVPKEFCSACQFRNSLSCSYWAGPMDSVCCLVCFMVQRSPFPFYPDAKKSVFSEVCDPSIPSICLDAYISSVTDSNKEGASVQWCPEISMKADLFR